jgi:hypothetical protein
VARRRALQFWWQMRHLQPPPASRAPIVVIASVVWHNGQIASRNAASAKGSGREGGGHELMVVMGAIV